MWDATRKKGRKGISFAYFSTLYNNYADILREVVHVYWCFFAS